MWKHKRNLIAREMLIKKSSAVVTQYWISTVLQSHSNKSAMLLAQNQIKDQQNRGLGNELSFLRWL
jgi:hypothetical protein